MERVKTAVIGLGSRGGSLLRDLFLGMDNILISAVCDDYEDRTKASSDDVVARGFERPFETTNYKEIIAQKKCEAAIVTTAWESHIEIACAFMEAGIPVGIEVGGAYSIEDCKLLVSTYEKTKTPFMFMENCYYDIHELMCLNMVRQGLFGEIVHADGGYQHDLRTEILFGKENRHYRLRNYIARNCDNYPTHELGPIMNILNIGHGDRMVKLTSMASKAAGLNDYARLHDNVDPSLRDQKFNQGDIVSTNILCESGATISLTLDTSLPRPYSRNFTIRGTRGMYQENANFVFMDSVNDESQHFCWQGQWNNAEEVLKTYEHPIWTRFKEDGVRGGHGGMDFLVYNDFIECIKSGEPMPIDVYDGVALMCITPLTELSIKNGSAPVEIPDFTNGKWKEKRNKDRFSIE